MSEAKFLNTGELVRALSDLRQELGGDGRDELAPILAAALSSAAEQEGIEEQPHDLLDRLSRDSSFRQDVLLLLSYYAPHRINELANLVQQVAPSMIDASTESGHEGASVLLGNEASDETECKARKARHKAKRKARRKAERSAKRKAGREAKREQAKREEAEREAEREAKREQAKREAERKEAERKKAEQEAEREEAKREAEQEAEQEAEREEAEREAKREQAKREQAKREEAKRKAVQEAVRKAEAKRQKAAEASKPPMVSPNLQIVPSLAQRTNPSRGATKDPFAHWLKCSICNEQFEDERNLNCHITRKHTKEK